MSLGTRHSFRELVDLKYQLYNGLFLALPFPQLGDIGIQLPVFAEFCRRRLEEAANPLEIVEEFFAERLAISSREQRLKILFMFLQLVERQVVLFDALEDAAYTELHSMNGPGTLTDLLEQVQQQGTQERLLHALSGYKTRLVLTAHPTQFYPEPVLNIIRDLGVAVRTNDLSSIEKLLLQMGKTPFKNQEAPTPETEALGLLRSHAATLYEVMGDIQYRLPGDQETVLELGFWPGGDRDGNPYVTADVTEATGRALRRTAVALHVEQLQRLQRRLTFKGFREELAALTARVAEDELLQADALLAELHSLRVTLRDEHQGLFIEELDRFIAMVQVFGMHFASLDIRQDSSVHGQLLAEQLGPHYLKLDEEQRIACLEQALREPSPKTLAQSDVLASLRAALKIQTQNGARSCHRYIISNCGRASQCLEVLLFMKWTGCQNMDIVPLFESVEDLQASKAVLERLFATPVYKEQLKRRSERQVVMLGFSDGTKDGGFLACNWEIFRCKRALKELEEQHGCAIVFFDGRGGPPARGGGNAHRFYRTLGYQVPQQEIQLTIQGQTISSKYGIPATARHNIEQLLTAGLEHRIHPRGEAQYSDEEMALWQTLSDLSYEAYVELKEHPQFLHYLENHTPLRYYGKLNIASRPPRRTAGGKLKLSDLRAIPFVGAWSQMKQNVPGYFGLGTALEKLFERGQGPRLKELYESSLFLRALVANAAQSLAKSNLELTRYLANDPDVGELWNLVAAESRRSQEYILRLSGHESLLQDEPVTKASIAMREQLILPLLVIQQYALQKHLGDPEDAVHEKLLLKSIPTIINASRNSA